MKTGTCFPAWLLAIVVLCTHCSPKQNQKSMEAVQLTFGPYGHMLNSAQAFSADDEWIAYDTRNDGTHIARTCCIEMVHATTGEVKKVYETAGQTAFGPGVGAVACNPVVPGTMIFIHGLLNCSASLPYGFTRRFGAVTDSSSHKRFTHAEARSVDEPLVPGALRGGTHAHTWSGDGAWISFTYNDALVEQLEKSTNGGLRDLRTIGVMAPVRPVIVPHTDAENFSGAYFSVVTATVTDQPAPGSDEIEKAFDECWIGRNGYLKQDGKRQVRAIAFQGHLRQRDGSLLTEIFVSDIPDDITRANPGLPLEGTATSRPNVPLGLVQRRVTFSENRKYPGVQGPRFWVRSAPDGMTLYFLMKDDHGIVEIYQVPVEGGNITQVTKTGYPVQWQFNISPDGKSIAFIADNSVWLADLNGNTSERVTPRATDGEAPVLGVLFNHAGTMLAFNRYVEDENGRNLQIFTCRLPGMR